MLSGGSPWRISTCPPINATVVMQGRTLSITSCSMSPNTSRRVYCNICSWKAEGSGVISDERLWGWWIDG